MEGEMLGAYFDGGAIDPAAPDVRFGILGPLEVTVGGRPVDPGPRRQRALTALLVLHPGEVLSTDRIVDALWGERPPKSVHHAIQVYVCNLRRGLAESGAAGDVIETQAPGYVLHAAVDAIDAGRAERFADEGAVLLEGGAPEEARASLEMALRQWRGEPLAEFTYEDFAAAEVRRLEELRLRVLELAISAELALGRHSEVVADLESLTVRYPTREGLWARLMSALDRGGRKAEALAAFGRAAAAIEAEFGVEPSPELRRLRDRIAREMGFGTADLTVAHPAESTSDRGGSWSRW